MMPGWTTQGTHRHRQAVSHKRNRQARPEAAGARVDGSAFRDAAASGVVRERVHGGAGPDNSL